MSINLPPSRKWEQIEFIILIIIIGILHKSTMEKFSAYLSGIRIEIKYLSFML